MPDNRQLLRDVFTQIEENIFFGDRLQEREFLSLSFPGQFVSPDLDETNAVDLAVQTTLTNQILEPSWIYKEQAGTLSSVYQNILDFAKLPQLTLTNEQKLEVQLIKDYIESNREDYEYYEEEYDLAEDDYIYAQQEDVPSRILARKLRKMNRAMRNWETLGSKLEYERQQARLNYLNSGDPNVAWELLEDQYKNSIITIDQGNIDDFSIPTQFVPTKFLPSVDKWSGRTIWNSITMEIETRNESEYSRSSSWSGGGGINFGLWSFGGGASGSSNFNRSTSEATNIKIEMKFARVKLWRPWLDSSIFSLKSWAWKPTFDQTLLSDGGQLDSEIPVAPRGKLPLLTTHLLIAKDVNISADWTDEEKENYEKSRKVSASAGWGPFRVKGSYHSKSGSKSVDIAMEKNKITIPDTQIIGYFGTLLPKCPNPNPDLTWE